MKYLWLIILLAAAGFWYFTEQRLRSPHDAYYAALLRENLEASAEQWAAEAEASLKNPLIIALPYSERRLLENEYPQPVTFSILLQADQLIQIDIIPAINTRAEIFVDVFLFKNDEFKDDGSAPARIDSMPVDKRQLIVSATKAGRYLVRIQPSHTAVGLFDIALTSPFRYGFPVDTDLNNPVQSFFGGDRDGGSRRHEGIDIFAPRGTPVIAVEAGRVSRVGESPRGGKHVWVSGDQRSFYYAHLDSTSVTAGERVARGQLLGRVGNTGNAITTNPHLHFGIYKRGRGAIDPLPLVGRKKEQTTYQLPDVDLAPRWLSVVPEKLNVRAGPSLNYSITNSLMRGELVRVDAVSGDWLRITAGNGEAGFIARRLTAIPMESDFEFDRLHHITQHRITHHRITLRPHQNAPVIDEFSIDQKLQSLGRFGEFTLIKMPSGVYGWASTAEAGDTNVQTSRASD